MTHTSLEVRLRFSSSLQDVVVLLRSNTIIDTTGEKQESVSRDHGGE